MLKLSKNFGGVFLRKRSFTKFLSVSLLLLFSFAVLPMQKVSAVDDPIVLDYIAINDFHGTVDDSASSSNPGIARIQTYLLGEKAKNPNTFFVSAGDQYQGSPISNLTYGEVVNDILAHMEMLTSAVGNHEFDWGADRIPLWAKSGGFPFVASNIVVEADKKPAEWDDYVEPYYVHNVTVDGKTIKVGFIGIATPETSYKVAAENVVGFTFTDPVEATKTWTTHLREVEKVDAVIALTHLGSFQKDGVISGEIVEYANGVSVDGIFSGHTHQVVNGIVNNIPIVQGQYNGRSLSKLSLSFNVEADDTVTLASVTGSTANIRDMKASLAEDPGVLAILKEYKEDLEPILSEELTVTENEISHDLTNRQVSPMGQFIAKTMAHLGETQIAIINGGGIRGGFEAGPITMGDMYSILPFDNTLVTLKVTGAKLKELIDHGINSPDFRSGQFYGINVWYDGTAPYKSRVTRMTLLDGTPIEDDTVYSVSTLDFVYTGGDKYNFSGATDVVDTYLPLRDLIADELRTMEKIDFTFAENIYDIHKKLDYFSINDFHGNVDSTGSSKNPGLARMATFLKNKMATNPLTYFLSSGDHFQGTAISNLTHGAVVNDVLKEMNLMASAIGNHEFDWGSDLIPQWAKDGEYYYLASNIDVLTSAKPVEWDDYVRPYIIQEQIINGQTVKVGFIGIATPETKFKTSAANVEGFTFTDPVEATNKWSKYLREVKGVDAVIALTHLGSFQKDGVISGEIVEYANGIEGVDAIFTGHTHQVVKGEVNGIDIVQGGYNGRSISNVSLHFVIDEDVVLEDVTASVTNLTELIPSLTEDEAVAAIIKNYYTELQPILGEVLGTLKNDLPHDTDTMQLSPMGQFIAKSLAELGNTQIAIVNGGGIRRGFEAGEITMGLMYELLPFDNTLVTMKVTGAELKKLLEHGLHPESFRPGQFYGVEVWYDKDKPAGERISSIRLLDGTLVKDDVTYTVSTLDFLLTGGDNYDFSKATDVVDTYIPVRDLIADMIREEEEISHTFLEHLHIGEDTTSENPTPEEPKPEEPKPEEPKPEKPTLPATGAASSGAFYGLGLISLMAGAYISRKDKKKAS